MKKYFLTILLAILAMSFLTSCEKEKSETLDFTTAESELNSFLQGSWEGIEYSLGVKYKTNFYIFAPRQTPEKITITLTDVVTIKHDHKVIGDTHLVVGFGNNDNIYDTDGDDFCYSYNAQNKIITFLTTVNGSVLMTKEDQYYIEKLSDTSFKMRAYGLADNESNWITYNKK